MTRDDSHGGKACPVVEGLGLRFETRKIGEVGILSHHLLVMVLSISWKR